MPQVISPSAIRAYKLSKYPAGQANRILLEAGKARRVTSQFMSKNGAKEAATRIRALKKTADDGIKVAKEGKKIADQGQKLWKLFTKADAFNRQATAVTNWGGILTALAVAGILTLIIKIQEFVQEANERGFDLLGNDLSKALSQAILATQAVKTLNKNFQEYKTRNDATNKELDKRTAQILKDNLTIKKDNNDIKYEVKKGREIVEQKIKSSENAINTRINKISETYQKVRADVDNLIKNTQAGVNKQIQETIAKIREAQINSDAKVKQANDGITAQSKVIASLQDAIKAIKPPTASDTNKIIADVTDKVKQFFNPQLSQLSEIPTIKTSVNRADVNATEAKNVSNAVKLDLSNLKITIDSRFDALVTQDRTLAGNISNLGSAIKQQNKNIADIDKKSVVADFSGLQKQLDAKFNQFVADNNKALNVRDLQQSKLSQDFDKKLADFINQSNLTNDQRFQQFQAQNKQDLNVRDGLTQSKLSQDFDKKIGEAINNFGKSSDQRYQDFIAGNKEALKIRDNVDQDLSRKISALESDNRRITADIGSLNTKVKEQEKVNIDAAKDIKQMLPLLTGLPARIDSIPNKVAQQVPNIPSIENAVQTGMCKSTAPGGCTKAALDDAVGNINQNSNANKGNILDALNAGGQAIDLSLLTTINNKLGDAIPGGLSGKLVDGFKWLQLDRALNVLTFAATVHNAMMLSNDIGQTFLGIISNALQLIGIKDDKGNAYDIGSVINSTVENLVKGIIGAENYTELSAAWQKANRVYQATTNILNQFQGLAQSILQANELIGAYTGRIGNALKKGGVVLENAYEWMNPQPKFNRITQGLEALQQTASTIQQVTQVPLDIVSQATELTNAATEFTKAIKEDGKPENKANTAVEPDTIKAQADASKTASVSPDIDISDFFNGNN